MYMYIHIQTFVYTYVYACIYLYTHTQMTYDTWHKIYRTCMNNTITLSRKCQAINNLEDLRGFETCVDICVCIIHLYIYINIHIYINIYIGHIIYHIFIQSNKSLIHNVSPHYGIWSFLHEESVKELHPKPHAGFMWSFTICHQKSLKEYPPNWTHMKVGRLCIKNQWINDLQNSRLDSYKLRWFGIGNQFNKNSLQSSRLDSYNIQSCFN